MKAILVSLLVLFSLNVSAQTCVGTWITIDDDSGKKKSKVKLYKYKGQLYGKITYLYPREGRADNAKCTKCDGDRKNKPLVGLQIVRNLKWDGSEWEGGTIVDPENGKVYTVKLWVDPNNKNKLKVRGYSWGFYRTQTWKRVTS